MNKIYADKKEFHKSAKWARMKFEYFRTHERLCAVCRNIDKIQNPITLHHISYERFGGDEAPTDLVPLCKKHHNMFHKEWDGDIQDPVALTEATEYFINAHRPEANIKLCSDPEVAVDQFTIMFIYKRWATV